MILIVLFASPLCFNKHKRADAAAAKKSVCELRYHGSRYGSENSNLIETWYHHYFCVACTVW